MPVDALKVGVHCFDAGEKQVVLQAVLVHLVQVACKRQDGLVLVVCLFNNVQDTFDHCFNGKGGDAGGIVRADFQVVDGSKDWLQDVDNLLQQRVFISRYFNKLLDLVQMGKAVLRSM